MLAQVVKLFIDISLFKNKLGFYNFYLQFEMILSQVKSYTYKSEKVRFPFLTFSSLKFLYFVNLFFSEILALNFIVSSLGPFQTSLALVIGNNLEFYK